MSLSDNTQMKTLVVNELLCFLNDRKDSVPFDNLVRIAADFYTWDEIANARNVLVNECKLDDRLPKRRGSGKENLVVSDLAKVLLDPLVIHPAFVALKISRLPSVLLEDMETVSVMNELSTIKLQLKELLAWKTSKEEVNSPLAAVGDIAITAADARSEDTGVKTFASVAQRGSGSMNEGSRGGKQLVTGSKPKSKPAAVIGKRGGGKLSTVPRKISCDYFVSRFEKDTTEEEVIEHVKEVKGDMLDMCVSVKKLKTRFDTYSSFHVKLTGSDVSVKAVRLLLDVEDGWPIGCFVRRYFDDNRLHVENK
jgi:hypothetical protein